MYPQPIIKQSVDEMGSDLREGRGINISRNNVLLLPAESQAKLRRTISKLVLLGGFL